jgi:cytochrome P450
MAWTVALLSQHSAALGRLQAELDDAWARAAAAGEAAPGREELDRLTYLAAVVKESLRMRPPVPANGRVLRQPRTLRWRDEAGRQRRLECPAGQLVLLSAYVAHLHPAN